MPTDHLPIARGVTLLQQYLKRRGISLYRFCLSHAFDRIRMQRIVNGTTRQVGVDLADDIEQATGGEVPIRAWRVTPPRVTVAMPAVAS